MHRSPRTGAIGSQSEDEMIAAQVVNSLPNLQESVAGLRTFPRVHDSGTTLDGNMRSNRTVPLLRVRQSHVNELPDDSSGSEDSDTNDEGRQDATAEEREDGRVSQASALVRDSYSRPR